MSKNINYDEIINLIKNEFIETMEMNPTYYEGVNFVLSREQFFVYKENFEPNTIYAVIKFGSTSVDFGSQVVPVTLNVLSEQNNIEIAQNLLNEFAETYNLTRGFDNTIQQIYTSPQITSNFNLMFSGYKSVMFLSGTFIISKNANFYKIKSYNSDVVCVESYKQNYENEYFLGFGTTDEEILANEQTFQEKVGYSTIDTFVFKYLGRTGYNAKWSLNGTELNEDISFYGLVCEDQYIEQMDGLENKFIFTVVTNYESYDTEKYNFEVPTIETTINTSYQSDSQPFYNTKNFTKSEIKAGTIVINMISFLLDDVELLNTCLAISMKDLGRVPEGVNKKLKTGLIFKNGIKLIEDFSLVDFTIKGAIGDIPVVSITLTN